MAKYLIAASYTADGVNGLLKAGGTSRAESVKQTIEGMGGKLEAFYFAFGADDAIVIVDLPDNVSAAAIGLAVSATGHTSARTTVLLTPDEIDRAAQLQVNYTPPGK
jgi:uncharacterized protein with GYD domain